MHQKYDCVGIGREFGRIWISEQEILREKLFIGDLNGHAGKAKVDMRWYMDSMYME